MDLQRLLLFVALSFVLLLLWEAWQQDYGRPVPPTAQPEATAPAGEPAPPTAEVPTVEGQVPEASPAPPPQATAAPSQQRIRVTTDVLDVEIDTVGGDLREARLLQYPVSVDRPDTPFQLMEGGPGRLFVAQSGFAARKNVSGDVLTAAPNHTTTYRAEQTEYRLEPGAESLTVPLHWTSPEGVRFVKRFTFTRGGYLVDVTHEVVNSTDKAWRGSVYQQFQRSAEGRESVFLYTYTGGVIYSPEDRYQKIAFDDMEDAALNKEFAGGWAAMIQHYFLGAWIPPAEIPHHYYSRVVRQDLYALGMYSREREVAPGASEAFPARLYVGPKLQDTLEEVAPGLELTVDYGFLTIISKPLFWLLDVIHGLVGNWGWAIIILTLLIKLAFYKLSETSYKSMAHMRKVQPRMVQIKERYGDDRQRMNQALMELYRKEKINPLGGCLPILVQIPVFIALYWVLLESVELRQAEWILWITDLSTRDPYYILPLLMGVTMLLQQRLNPAPLDPIQAKVMMVLPIVFTVFFAFFPAGLVLYWVANNALSIAQQWYITRVVMKEK